MQSIFYLRYLELFSVIPVDSGGYSFFEGGSEAGTALIGSMWRCIMNVGYLRVKIHVLEVEMAIDFQCRRCETPDLLGWAFGLLRTT